MLYVGSIFLLTNVKALSILITYRTSTVEAALILYSMSFSRSPSSESLELDSATSRSYERNREDGKVKEVPYLNNIFTGTGEERFRRLVEGCRSKAISCMQWAHNFPVSKPWDRNLAESISAQPGQVSGRIAVFIGIAVIVLLSPVYLMNGDPFSSKSDSLKLSPTREHFEKPEGFKIYGLVFYGRHYMVDILDCYLRKSLVSNGGWLDAVHFVINTDDQADIAWIDEVVAQVEDYKKIELEEGTNPHKYGAVWAQAVESGPLYIKLDDDLVWMGDTAIEELVTTMVNHPEALGVLANLINSAALGWVHHHNGAIHSYLPELEPPLEPSSASYGPQAWRASALPSYQPADGSNETMPSPQIERALDRRRIAIGDEDGAPYANHRWLPLRDNGTLLSLTPMWETSYNPWGDDWKKWQHGAQQHYSFLQNLESGDLSSYHFGDKEGIWNMRYVRANINLMAVWGDDVLDHLPETTDDENDLSIDLPKKLNRQTYIQTKAIASHFSFDPQREMYDTDLLSRYRAYANENICGKDNQIPIPEQPDPSKHEDKS